MRFWHLVALSRANPATCARRVRRPAVRRPTRRRPSARPAAIARCEFLEERLLLTFDPSPFEQELFEHINRARLDPAAELQVLLSSYPDPLLATDPDVQAALSYFQVDGQLLQSQWTALTSLPPLAWNASLFDAARLHNQVMIDADTQTHQMDGMEPSLLTRLLNAGYDALAMAGENVYAFAESVFHAHAALLIDWGEGDGGLQPPDHRRNILGEVFHDVGVAVALDDFSENEVGPFVITQDFGSVADARDANILGVVYYDSDADGLYDAGEGLGNLQVTASGPSGVYETSSWSAGGYQLQVPPGTYDVSLVAEGLPFPITRRDVVVTGQNYAAGGFQNANVKVDFNLADLSALSVTFADGEIMESDGSQATVLTVSRVGDRSQPLTVTLEMDPQSTLILPDSVVIPAGEDSVTVPVDVIDDDRLEGVEVVSVLASAAGYESASSMLDVIDDEIVTIVGPLGTVHETTPKFQWDGLNGATQYELWVDQIGGPRRLIYEGGLEQTAHTPRNDLDPGAYRFWVRARNSDGAVSRWSEVAEFTIDAPALGTPVLTAPASAVSVSMPVFSWTQAENAESYELWVDQFGGTKRVIHESGLGETSFTPTVPLELGAYRAWVRAADGTGRRSAWSTARDFSIVEDVARPGFPEFIAPAAVTSSPAPLVVWTEVENAARYELWIDASSSESVRVVHATDLHTAQHQTDALGWGQYRAWVRAFNSEDETSGWSAPHDFRIVGDVPPPSAPTVITPSFPISSATPTLKWAQGLYDAGYLVWIEAVGAASPLAVTHTLHPFYTLSTALTVGNYQAWVQAINSEGERSPWSSAFDFTVVEDVPVPGQPQVTGPAVATADASPAISWTAQETAAYYDLWVDQVGGTRKILRARTGAVTEFVPEQELPVGSTYRTWVRAVNAEGEASAWSAPYEFTVVAPEPVASDDPIDPILTGPVPALEWNPVANAAHYDLFLVKQQTAETVLKVLKLTEVRYEPELQLPVGDYLAVVRPMTADGQLADVDQVLQVTVTAPTLPVPSVTLTKLSNGDLQAQWSVDDAVSQADRELHFELRVERTGAVLPVVWADMLTTDRYGIDSQLLEPGDYRLWVRVVDASGTAGLWSEPLEFQVVLTDGLEATDALEFAASDQDDDSDPDVVVALVAARDVSRSPEREAPSDRPMTSSETPRDDVPGSAESANSSDVTAFSEPRVTHPSAYPVTTAASRALLDRLLTHWPELDWWNAADAAS